MAAPILHGAMTDESYGIVYDRFKVAAFRSSARAVEGRRRGRDGSGPAGRAETGSPPTRNKLERRKKEELP
jgi:hypothetical protein